MTESELQKFVYNNLPVHDLESDKKLFSLLRTNYNFHRKRWWSFLSLWELQRIDFVHFEMYDGPLIDIKEIHSLPPQEYRTTYLYDRPIINPPIGTNLLMHYLRCPHEASSKTPCLEKMPKKMNDKLNVCPIKGISPGWGLYFVEDWNWKKILIGTYLTFMGSGIIVGVVCWWLDHSIQDAFAVAGFVVACFATGVGASQAWLNIL